MTFSVPKDHPRYHSLVARHRLEDGVARGITTMTGLIAHGRGEAFDYLLGERSHEFAATAARVAAVMLVEAKKPVISTNGNTAVLVPEEMIALSKTLDAPIELNIFHDTANRRELMGEYFRELGVGVLGIRPDRMIEGLTSERAKVDSRGIYEADVVLVALEDGDRTEVLVRGGKKVIAIDLNPLSRTPKMATVAIVDHVARALPLIEKSVVEVRRLSAEKRAEILRGYDHRAILEASERAIRSGGVK